MIKNYFLGFLALLCMTLTMASCQSTEHETDDNVRQVSLNLHVTQFEQVPLTRLWSPQGPRMCRRCARICVLPFMTCGINS